MESSRSTQVLAEFLLSKVKKLDESEATLIYDLRGADQAFSAFARIARKYNVSLGCSTKAFPDGPGLAAVSHHAAFFDVSNAAEFARTTSYRRDCGYFFTAPLTDGLQTLLGEERCADALKRVIEDKTLYIVADCLDEVSSIIQQLNSPDMNIGLRVKLGGVDTLGPYIALQRFGETVSDILGAAGRRDCKQLRGFHCHCAGRRSTETMTLQARKLIEISRESGARLEFLNLGGGIPLSSQQEFEQLLCSLRKEVPLSIRLFLQPGEGGCGRGFAVGKIARTKQLHKTAWSGCNNRLMRMPPSPVTARVLSPGLSCDPGTLLYCVGPTCFHNDILLGCKSTVAFFLPDSLKGWLILKHVSIYSACWNHSFNGIRPASIIYID